METLSALLATCAGNSSVPVEFSAQRLVTQGFDVFFDLHPNKQSWGQWFETPSRPLWRHCNVRHNFNSNWNAIEVRVWMNNYIPLFYVDTITDPCPNTDTGSTTVKSLIL